MNQYALNSDNVRTAVGPRGSGESVTRYAWTMLHRSAWLVLVFAVPAAAEPLGGKAFVESQLPDEMVKLRATFEPDALVIHPEGVTSGALPDDQVEGFIRSDEATFDDRKLGKLTSGTRGEVTWIVADVIQPWAILGDCPPALKRCHRTRTLRFTELVVGGKAVVAHIDEPVAKRPKEELERSAIPSGTEAGTLTPLLTNPTALAAALLDDPAVSVLGTERSERAVGVAAAKKLLKSWSKLALTIDGQAREVRTKTWAWAAANVNWTTKKKTVKMRATVFAVDTGSGWKVVAAHYSLPYHRVMYE